MRSAFCAYTLVLLAAVASGHASQLGLQQDLPRSNAQISGMFPTNEPDSISGGMPAFALRSPFTLIYPSHVAIYMLRAQNYIHICGGTIVSKTHVITAGHCVWDNSRRKPLAHSMFKIVVGKRMRDYYHQDELAQSRDVQEIVVHPRFSGANNNWQSDIALIILAEEIEFSSLVKPSTLDLDDRFTSSSAGKEGIVAGWGVTETGNPSEFLQYVRLPLINIDTCYESLQDDLKKFATDDKICAGYLHKDISTCQGDSGGGLTVSSRGKSILIGVVSIAFKPAGFQGTCYSDHYTAFTLVTARAIRALVKRASPSAQVHLLPLLGIPAGYTRLAEFGFYKLHNTPMTWFEAWKTCLTEGAHLAELASWDEQRAVAEEFLKSDNAECYVSTDGFDLKAELIAILRRLSRGQCDQHGNNVEDCAVLYASGGLTTLHGACNSPRNFICKINES